jgi:hypothetical protein
MYVQIDQPRKYHLIIGQFQKNHILYSQWRFTGHNTHDSAMLDKNCLYRLATEHVNGIAHDA